VYYLIFQAGIALSICQTLATAMGPNIKQHVRTLGAGIISNFADSKVGHVDVSSLMCCRVTALSMGSAMCQKFKQLNYHY
jgi:hypothetical protein